MVVYGANVRLNPEAILLFMGAVVVHLEAVHGGTAALGLRFHFLALAGAVSELPRSTSCSLSANASGCVTNPP
jgi:hypothetical protein